MSIDQDTIDILYGDKEPSTPVQAEPDATPAQPDSEASSTTDEYGYKKPAEKQAGNQYALEQDKNSVQNEFYGAESCLILSDETDLGIIGSDADEQANLSRNLGQMASEVGATQADIHDLVTHANKLIITDERSDPAATMSTLYEQHGAELHQKLDDAQTLIRSLPDLSTWLDQTGAGDDPVIINQIMRIAQTPRAQARLQKLRNK